VRIWLGDALSVGGGGQDESLAEFKNPPFPGLHRFRTEVPFSQAADRGTRLVGMDAPLPGAGGIA